MDRTLLLGTAEDLIGTIPPGSIDAMITDPPSGISFMGMAWDTDKGGRDAWIAWLAGIMRGARTACKPGAYAFVWALPRTSHWTAYAMEEAGWEVRDVVNHIFGQGWPKSKALLKPATEHWILCKAPGRVLPLNVDDCRVPGVVTDDFASIRTSTDRFSGTYNNGKVLAEKQDHFEGHPQGRWPADVVYTHHPECILLGTKRIPSASPAVPMPAGGTGHTYGIKNGVGRSGEMSVGYADADGTEGVEDTQCHPMCPVPLLDRQSGQSSGGRYPAHLTGSSLFGLDGHEQAERPMGDSGGASRYFNVFWPEADPFCYTAKARRSEKDRNLAADPDGGRANAHPTVKPVALMAWLTALIAGPGDHVLDPFMGTGTTGIAAISRGCAFTGIEQDPKWHAVAERRIDRLQIALF